ncbi:MAG TPA: hypothetical protein VFP93_00090 [Gammaproteobacteria bacterium]|nr:hypothetical protein [Gammaproteobacteria bacterium]
MILKKISLLFGCAILTASAYAQYDFGYEVGAGHYNLNGVTKTRPSNNFKVGFTDDASKLGVDAIYNMVPKTSYGPSSAHVDQRVQGVKLLAKADLDIIERFTATVRGGLGYEHVRSHMSSRVNSEVTSSSSSRTDEYFPSVAAGLNFDATQQMQLGLKVNHDARKDYKFKDNTYVTLGFTYLLPSGKTLA